MQTVFTEGENFLTDFEKFQKFCLVGEKLFNEHSRKWLVKNLNKTEDLHSKAIIGQTILMHFNYFAEQ